MIFSLVRFDVYETTDVIGATVELPEHFKKGSNTRYINTCIGEYFKTVNVYMVLSSKSCLQT